MLKFESGFPDFPAFGPHLRILTPDLLRIRGFTPHSASGGFPRSSKFTLEQESAFTPDLRRIP
jgi:hypothetical protein